VPGTSLGPMHLPDSRTGSDAVIRPARPGVLRVCAHVPAGPALTGLRVLLIADLLVRAAELRHLQGFAAWEFAGQPEDPERAAALNIHPPSGQTDDPADVHVVSRDGVADGQGGIVVQAGDVTGHEEALARPDPLALRLALLSRPHHQPVELTDDDLTEAGVTLRRWRQQVAGWAESPSRPVPEPLAVALGTALDGLDTGAMLALLRGPASSDDLAPGAKFETFVYADRILGLDLGRDIGRAM
jgi:hypothetical protein